MGRAKRLRAATHGIHGGLDRMIMAQRPFADLERYGRFLRVQFDFHSAVDPYYQHPVLADLIPDIGTRNRLGLVRQDLVDIGLDVPVFNDAGPEQSDHATALGWLYVAEGSTLGAAFLIKQVAALGLGPDFGARHLAAAPDGRGLHWRTFTAALDGVFLSDAEEARAITGAQHAFGRVSDLVQNVFAV